MARSTVTSKGQITIPKRIRDRLNLNPGDQIDFTVDKDSNLIGKRVDEGVATKLAGSLKHLAREQPISVEAMKAAVRRRVADKRTRAGTQELDDLNDGGDDNDSVDRDE